MVYIYGDTHMNFYEIEYRLKKCNENDIIIICGDFGYWQDKNNDFAYKNVKNKKGTKIYWCDGNHEQFDILNKLVDENGYKNPIDIGNGFHYCPRGSSLTLDDGRNILFFGGAYSIDRKYRKLGYSYFEEEVISDDDIKRLDSSMKYDIIVSHTCPSMCLGKIHMPYYYYGFDKIKDTSCDKLQTIFEMYHPKRWYFGHWHMYQQFTMQGCKFTMLNRCDDINSYYFMTFLKKHK